MRDEEKLPGKIVQDMDAVQRACDIIGGMTKEDKELVAWIAAADVVQMEERENADKSIQES